MKKWIVVLVAVMFVCTLSFAQIGAKGEVNVDGIKESVTQAQAQVKTYDVPFVASAQKADGTGPVDVVTYQRVTKAQLTQIIANATKQVVTMQKQISDAQLQLDKIVELENV